MVLRKAYLQRIRPFIGTDVIKVITGIRRSGKSVFLTQLLDEILKSSPETHTVYLNLEDKKNAKFLNGDELYQFLLAEISMAGNKRVCFFLDEVHDAEGWETTVKGEKQVFEAGEDMLRGRIQKCFQGNWHRR